MAMSGVLQVCHHHKKTKDGSANQPVAGGGLEKDVLFKIGPTEVDSSGQKGEPAEEAP